MLHAMLAASIQDQPLGAVFRPSAEMFIENIQTEPTKVPTECEMLFKEKTYERLPSGVDGIDIQSTAAIVLRYGFEEAKGGYESGNGLPLGEIDIHDIARRCIAALSAYEDGEALTMPTGGDHDLAANCTRILRALIRLRIAGRIAWSHKRGIRLAADLVA